MTRLTDPSDQLPPRHGLLLLQVCIVILFAVFFLRFWWLQVHKGHHYAERARANQLRQELMYAPRGLIRDAGDELLAVNEPAYALALIREDVQDLDATMEAVSRWTGVSPQSLDQTYTKARKRVKPFEPLILVSDLTFDQLALIKSQQMRWPGLEIVVRARRNYKYGVLLSHVLGYVAEANENELEEDPTLSMGDEVGKNGLELTMEDRLRGTKGLQQFEVDVSGRRLGETVLKPPVAGENLRLSIDMSLQSRIYDMIRDKEASAVVMDADTGHLLALVSSPGYDSNAFSSGLTPKQWKTLSTDPRHPMQNRAIQSVYPPGSVFKLAMASFGLQTGAITPEDTVTCLGQVKLGSHVFRCWKRGGHGKVNLDRALIESCDVYFYKLGMKLGVDVISEMSKGSGFGLLTGIDLPHEKSGLIPSRDWKRKRFGERWQRGEDLNLSIGQGYTLVSPLQVARFISALINGGTLLKPELLRDEDPVPQGRLPVADWVRAFVRKSMINTVEDPRGTCRRIRTKGVVAGAKTGTAQVVRLTDELKALKDEEIPYRFRDHAWMAGFAQKDDKRYSIVVMVEHGLHGGSGAGPVVKSIIRHLFVDNTDQSATED